MAERVRSRGRHPTQLVVLAFSIAIAVGTALLLLPVAHRSGQHPGVVRTFLTATSAVTVTGVAAVDIENWSLFGELVLLALVQIGGFGIMTIGAVLALLASARLGLRQRMVTQAELGAVSAGDMRQLVGAIARLTVVVELGVAVMLGLRFWQSGTEEPVRAFYSGLFHAITAFNNAGVSLYPDSLTRFRSDGFVILVVTLAIIVGGLGFPVLVELRRRRGWRRWTLHTKLTMFMTAVLVIVGPLTILVFEWSNRGTLGTLGVVDKLLASWLQGVSPRSAGFNTISYAAMNPHTLMVVLGLMFIGAGSASTSGGIKVSTFALIGAAVWSELRGDADTSVFRRRIPVVAVRQAITVVILSITTVFAATLGLLVLADIDVFEGLFEATSAFGTVGLSLGVTGRLNAPAQVLLSLVMLAGRVGPTTFAAAFVVRERQRLYRHPEERPIIG